MLSKKDKKIKDTTRQVFKSGKKKKDKNIDSNIVQAYLQKLRANRNKGKESEEEFYIKIPSEKDLIVPTMMKEIDKKDITLEGKPNGYYVEVGTTVEMVRYFRSFFALFTGENTYFGMLQELFLGNFGNADCDVLIHVKPTDDAKTRYRLSRQIANLEADLDNAKDSVKAKKIRDQLFELHGQEERLRKNLEQLFDAALQVIVSGNSLENVKKFGNTMIKRLSSNDVFLKSADTYQLPALLYSTPFDPPGKRFKHTFQPVETSNLADWFMFGFGTISHKKGVLIGKDVFGNPVFYDDRHPTLQNYNSVTFGQSGSGKSMKHKILKGRSTLGQSRNTFIDFEHENREWIRELGFPYIEFTSTNDEYTLNVFPRPRIVMTKSGKRYCDLDDAVNTVAAAVFKMIRTVTERPITGVKKIRIKEAIQNCYTEECGITYDPESLFEEDNKLANGKFSLERRAKPIPQLIHLYDQFKRFEELKEELLIIKSFTKAGTIRSQAVFDCQTTVDFREHLLIGMSVEGLDEIMQNLGLYIGTSNVWSVYERLPKAIKKGITVDEAQNMMEEDEEATWFEQRFRISRRRNIGMDAITQGFEVFLRKKQGLGILKNASTKWLLRQDSMDIEAVRGKFNLPEGTKQQLLTFDKGDCILIAGNEMTMMRTAFSPREDELFSTDPNEVEEVV